MTFTLNCVVHSVFRGTLVTSHDVHVKLCCPQCLPGCPGGPWSRHMTFTLDCVVHSVFRGVPGDPGEDGDIMEEWELG